MGAPLTESIEDWAAGVITNQQVDDLPHNASPRGRNAALVPIAGGRASVMKRKGMAVVNTTAITGSPAIVGQVYFPRVSGGAITRYHLLISDGGRLDKRNADTTTSAADSTSGTTTTPFTSGSYYPDSAIANYLAFLCNGQATTFASGPTTGIKFNGTNVQRWGISAPTNAPTLTDSGVAGNPNGTYEAYVTYYNSATDHESSPGPTSSTLTVASKKINWSWTASADSQVTHVRLYRRNTATQPKFYRVTEVAIGTTTYSNDNATDASLIIPGPLANQYDPPPAGTKLCEWHYSRMFISDGTDVYFSEEGKPEAFDPTNTLPGINSQEGEEVTALHATAGVLLITKRSKTYLLVGDDPSNWHIELLSADTGCVSHRSMLSVNAVARWWSLKGLVEWAGEGAIMVPGQVLLAPSISPEVIDFSQLSLIVAAEDPTQQRILFGLPELNQTRNTIYIPYSYRLRAFESDQWQATDAASLCTVEDHSTGIPYLYAGGYKGQVFRWWSGDNDGIASDTTSTGTVTASTGTTLSDSTATFDTTGAGLVERYVVAVASDGTTQRRRITANTTTQLTISSAWDTNPVVGWTYLVGGPQFAWDTRYMTGTVAFIRKRVQFLYLLAATTASSVDLTLSVFLDYATTAAKTITSTLTATAAKFGSAVFDVSMFGSQGTSHKRLRVAKKAHSWRLRIENFYPDSPVVLHKVAALSELLSDKHTT